MPLTGKVEPGGSQGLNPRTALVAEPPLGHVGFYSTDIDLYVVAMFNGGGFRPVGGGSRHDVSDRVKETGVAEYRGHDPLRVAVSVLFDGFPDGRPVQRDIRALLRLTEKMPTEDRMPVIRLYGAIPFYKGRRWVVDGPPEFDEDPRPIKINGKLYRQAITLTLLERVRDTVLTDSVSRGKRRGKGAKKTPQVYIAKRRDHDLGDVSKAVYKTRNRAVDIAQFNRISVSIRVTAGMRFRIP